MDQGSVGASGELEAVVTHHPPQGEATAEHPQIDDKKPAENLAEKRSLGDSLHLAAAFVLVVYGGWSLGATAVSLIRAHDAHSLWSFVAFVAVCSFLLALIHFTPASKG